MQLLCIDAACLQSQVLTSLVCGTHLLHFSKRLVVNGRHLIAQSIRAIHIEACRRHTKRHNLVLTT
jgi:hypothetical protein